MEKKEKSKSCSLEDELITKENQKLLLILPRVRNWDGLYLYEYQGFWCSSRSIQGMIFFQRHFQAQDTDIFLITFPKSGTTWLKALTFAIVNRTHYTIENSPLLTSSPHELVPFLELDLYIKNQYPKLEDLPRPRSFATHAPYASLPNCIVHSNSRIVYLCRNPLDQFISHWQFYLKLRNETMEPLSLEEAFEMFCGGVHSYGPFWDHVLGYWKASLEEPHKVLFLKYEEMKEDNLFHIKKLAKFLGFPFSVEEETQGVIEEISKLCSFKNMKELEANKTGKHPGGAQNKSFFRKGEVGDWANYLTPSMSQRIEKLMEEKLAGSGLSFK